MHQLGRTMVFTARERRLLFMIALFLLGGYLISFLRLTELLPDIDKSDNYLPTTQSDTAVANTDNKWPGADLPRVREEDHYLDSWLDLNRADSLELIALPGIGPQLAHRILIYRTKQGAFKSVDEIRNVKGIGDKRLQQLSGYLTVEE